MKTVPSTYEELDLDDVTPHPENPREGDVGAIYESIDANGFYGAIVVQKSTGYVLAGNHRLAAAAAHGMTRIPAIVVDVDDVRAKKILLADNRTADLATQDFGKLAELLEDLHIDFDLVGTGYSPEDLDDLLAVAAGPPDLEDVAAGSTSLPGDDRLSLEVGPLTRDLWLAHRRGFDSDDEALHALLDPEA